MSDRLLGRPTSTAGALRARIRSLETSLEAAKAGLARIEVSCHHDWTDPEYTPERRKGYSTQSLRGHFTKNSDGTINAPTVHIPPETIDKWTRTCRKCGKVEATSRTNVREVRTPRF